MSGGDQDRLHQLFDAALDATGAAREALLEETAREDPDLAAELRRLLARFTEEEDFLEDSPFPNLASMVPKDRLDDWDRPAEDLPTLDMKRMPEVTAAWREPEQIGEYQILEKIGEGGMGAVYLARQARPERKVALKLIHRNKVNPTFLARFEREYRVLAMMNHNNIARIYEAGQTADGDPFFTMEYVAGASITQFCREHDLDLAEKVRLFMQVCEGVQHAHQKAVVHRDLKPNNIMVTLENGRAVIKLIDFGIAKDLSIEETALQTQTGAFMGTPVYMSPEQIASGSSGDTRGDVYALGVILYELLTGLPPIDPASVRDRSLFEMLEHYKSTDPPRPSRRLRDAASEEIQREVSLHLRGDLDWVVMKAMEKDIERRYQSPSALREDLERFVAGRPVAARPPTFTYQFVKFTKRNRALVGASFLVFLSLVVALWISISANARTYRALARQQEANRFLQEMLSAPDPRGGGVNARVIDILEPAAERLDDIDDPIFEAEMRTTLGTTFYGLAQYQRAEAFHRRAVALNLESFGQNDRRTLESQYSLGRAIRRQRRYEETMAILSRVADKQRDLFGPNDEDTLQTREQIALVHIGLGDYEKAREVYETLIPLMKAHLGEDHPTTLRAINGFGNAYRYLKDYGRALELYESVWTAQKKKLGPEHIETLSTESNIGGTLRMKGELDRAIVVFENNMERRSRVQGNNPGIDSTRYLLGTSLAEAGRTEEAVPHLEQTVDFRIGKYGWKDQRTVSAVYSLSLATMNRDPSGAASMLLSLITTISDQPYRDFEEVYLIRELMNAYRESGNLAALLGIALSLQESDSRSMKFQSFINTGKSLETLNDLQGEVTAYCNALTLFEDDNSKERVEASARYGYAMVRLGQLDEGNAYLDWASSAKNLLPSMLRDLPDHLRDRSRRR